MTVKIINSIPDPSVIKNIVCRTCGVTLQYTPNDVKSKEHQDYLGDKEVIKYIDCPNCTSQVHVSQRR